MMSYEPFRVDDVQGFLHRSAGDERGGMVLTHGAGSDCKSPLLVAVAEAFASASVTVLRCNMPFRQRRASGPPGAGDGPKDRAGLKAAVMALKSVVAGDMSLAGVSYGGRQASLLAADEAGLVENLLLLAYPLHPPGKPAELRTAHFPKLRTPTLLVQGSRDPFGSIAELEIALKVIPAPHALVAIDGAGHELKRGKFNLAPVIDRLALL